jgi:hypothetical protein
MVDPRFYNLTAHLHRGGEFGHYWTPDATDENGNSAKVSHWFPVGDETPVKASWEELNSYFSVHPSRIKRNPYEKLHIEDVAAINCLYAEFDAGAGSKSTLFTHVADLDPQPNIIIDSGGGYHAYWLLLEPGVIGVDISREDAQKLQYAWVEMVGGDEGAKDLARVLRIPGTLNTKYDPARTVDIIRYDTGQIRPYTLDELSALAQPTIARIEEEKAATAAMSTPSPSSVAMDATDQELIEKARNSSNGAKFERLWAGDLGDYGGDHSQADLGLCNILAFWTGRDITRMDRIFRQSGLYREKWEREDYRTGTLQDAVDNTQKTYDPVNHNDAAVKAAQDAVGVLNGSSVNMSTPSVNGAQKATETDVKAKMSLRVRQDLRDWGYTLRMNQLDDSVEINGERMTDAVKSVVRTRARDEGYGDYKTGKPTLGALEDVLMSTAQKNSYHPVRDYFDDLEWNGQDHIGQLAGFFVDAHDPIVYDDGFERSVFEACLRRWLYGAVAKVFVTSGAIRPQNPVLVLVGGQELGKSTFAQWLCPLPERFLSAPVRPDAKDDHVNLMTKLVWEIGEIGSTTRRADREALKWFITLQNVTVRIPYAKYDITKPALSSFIGTLNPEQGYLTDPTGNRRFVTVELNSIDHSYSKAVDIAQVWAQALDAWRQNPNAHNYSIEERKIIREINDSHKTTGAHAGLLEKLFQIDASEVGWFTPTADIVSEMHDKHGVSITASLEQLVGSTLQGMGCKRERRTSKGRRQWGYTGIRLIP